MGIDIASLRPEIRKQVLAQLAAKALKAPPMTLIDAHDGKVSYAPVQTAKKPRMNKTETELYGILKARGYDRVEFEAITLTLATGSKYTPDFMCVKDGAISFFEAKNNFIREASLVRLKVAARAYPFFIFILAQKKLGHWTEKLVEK